MRACDLFFVVRVSEPGPSLGENSDLRTYQNPSAAITSACRKEVDRLRPNIAGLPGSSGRSD